MVWAQTKDFIGNQQPHESENNYLFLSWLFSITLENIGICLIIIRILHMTLTHDSVGLHAKWVTTFPSRFDYDWRIGIFAFSWWLFDVSQNRISCRIDDCRCYFIVIKLYFIVSLVKYRYKIAELIWLLRLAALDVLTWNDSSSCGNS